MADRSTRRNPTPVLLIQPQGFASRLVGLHERDLDQGPFCELIDQANNLSITEDHMASRNAISPGCRNANRSGSLLLSLFCLRAITRHQPLLALKLCSANAAWRDYATFILADSCEVKRVWWQPASHSRSRHFQPITELVARAVFRRDAEAADIPASRAACRTPLPAISAILAFSTLALAIGGRPNLMDKLRAAA